MNRAILFIAGLVLAFVVAGPAGAESVRFASFNASMNRGAEGELAAALASGKDRQIAKVAAIIRSVDPDVILINEFDYGAGNDRAFVANYLGGSYAFSFIAPSNTGLATGLDLDGDGIVGKEAGTFRARPRLPRLRHFRGAVRHGPAVEARDRRRGRAHLPDLPVDGHAGGEARAPAGRRTPLRR